MADGMQITRAVVWLDGVGLELNLDEPFREQIQAYRRGREGEECEGA